MLRKVLLVMGGTLASRVLGLVRQAVFNALYPDPSRTPSTWPTGYRTS